MNQKQELRINVEKTNLEAHYSDVALIGHQPSAFNLDFGQQVPQMKMVNIVSRIVLSPQHAKSLTQVLAKHVEAYEKQHGTIEISASVQQSMENKQIGFQPPPEN